MGKSSKPYSSGTININGQQKANVSMDGNNVVSNYNMTDAEKKIYDYAQNSFMNSLPNVNVFSDDTIRGFQSQLGAYTQNGIKTLNNIYDPMISNLKTDIASRFGNFDNSSFLDKLDSIEDNRGDAVNSFTQDILAKQNELVNDELSRRYNYLNLLSGIQSTADSNIMNYLSSALQNSSSGNSYNNMAMRNNLAQMQAYSNMAGQMLGGGSGGTLGSLASMLGPMASKLGSFL